MGYKVIIQKVGSFLPTFFRALPAGFTFIMVFISLFGSLIASIQAGDPLIFIRALGERIFAADYALGQTIESMIEGTHDRSHTYLLLDSLSNIFVLYYLVKILSAILKKIIGKTGSPIGFVFVSVVMLGLIEMAVAGVIERELIIPYHGLYSFISSPDILFGPYIESYNEIINAINEIDENQNKTVIDLVK